MGLVIRYTKIASAKNMSPTQRSLKELRRLGYTVQVVERWNPFAHIRQDLFGFIDILAIRPGEILGVQATSAANHASRVTKSSQHGNFRPWRSAGGLFEVWSWRQGGPRGKRKTWMLRREVIN